MSNSNLVVFTRISPNSDNPRRNKINKITIHHMAGNLSIETCGNVFQTREASSHYGIGSDGRIGQYVDEANRPWTSSSGVNDHQAVTIEVANDGGAPDWHVSDRALESLINLCVDICKRNDIKSLNYTGDANGNLTRHNMFIATTCPGPYLQSKFPYVAEEVNKRLAPQPKPEPVDPYLGISNEELARRVWTGEFGNGQDRVNALGIRYNEVQALVEQGVGKPEAPKPEPVTPPTPSFDLLELVRRTIRGDFGNGPARVKALGENYKEVQEQVNRNISAGNYQWDKIRLY